MPSRIKKILLIEDNLDHAELLIAAVQKLNHSTNTRFSISVSTSANEGLKEIEQKSFDTVLLDYSLPDMDGLEVLKKLRQKHLSIPVIVITGQGDEKTAVQAMKLGAYDYVIKEHGLFSVLPRTIAKAIEHFDREQETARLEKENKLLAYTIMNIGESVIMTDPKGKLVFLNKASERLLKYEGKEIIGKDVRRLFSKKNPSEVMTDLWNAVYKKRQCWLGEILKTSKNNEDFLASVAFYIIWDERDNVLSVIEMFKDITEIKRSEQLQRQYQAELESTRPLAALGEMASRIAHEIRNPLAKIMTGTDYMKVELLKKELCHTDSTLSKMMDAVLNGVETLNGVVTEILEYTRPMELRAGILDVHEVLESSLSTVEEECQSDNIKLERQYQKRVQTIQGESMKLKQAFVNIIKNAHEAMPNGGSLTIQTRMGIGPRGATSRTLEINFIDSGSGINPDNLQKVFTPFFTTKEQGTGLGLSIVKRIINLHQGTVKLMSCRGMGTHVIISIPTTQSS